MAGPLAAGATGAVVPGGQSAETADAEAVAVLRPSSGAADMAPAASPVDAMRFRRVSSDRGARPPGSGVDGVIRVCLSGVMVWTAEVCWLVRFWLRAR